jgi:biopolymer transport protein ExbD
MKRTLTALIAISLLLLVIILNSSKLNSSSSSEPQVDVETPRDQEIVDTEKTETIQIQENGSETNTCSNQNFSEESLQEIENQQSNPPSQNSEEPNAVNCDENVVPPDGRIYYSTSPESPYAYTPTNTPKGLDMPIAPPEQES